MLKSMKLRLTLAFITLLSIFGYFVYISVTHSQALQQHFIHDSQQHHIRVALSTFILVLLPVISAGAWAIVNRTLKPLKDLSRQASEASADNLAIRLASPSSDSEMVAMVRTLNDLLSRIEATAKSKSQFYAAASHELRTPVQALSGFLETALSKERSADEYKATLVEAQKQTERITRLMVDILLLHQIQTRVADPQERANMSQSIDTSLLELSPLTEVRKIKIKAFVEPEVFVKGYQSYADIVVRNLIENAARYATLGSEIEITLSNKELTIMNSCDFKLSMDEKQMFEPFSKFLSESNPTGGGNGLGLTVCQAAVKANGWKIEINAHSTTFNVKVSFN
ncbi:MAG: histidine kinase dimerization/phospho-acceptor domain-containing protein [Fimbriimonadaceae bacterium]